jgi:hypothetical protein
MGIMNKAKEKATKPEAKKDSGSTWLLDREDPLNAVVADLVKLDRERTAIEGKIDQHLTALVQFGRRRLAHEYSTQGKKPGMPITIQNSEGHQVTFVVTDKSGSAAVKDDQVESLARILGEDGAQALLYEETTYKLNQQVLSLPGVFDGVEKALEAAVKKLHKAGKLTEEQSEAIIEADRKRTFTPKLLDRVPEICGRDTARTAEFLGALGSSLSTFIKV